MMRFENFLNWWYLDEIFGFSVNVRMEMLACAESILGKTCIFRVRGTLYWIGQGSSKFMATCDLILKYGLHRYKQIKKCLYCIRVGLKGNMTTVVLTRGRENRYTQRHIEGRPPCRDRGRDFRDEFTSRRLRSTTRR